MRVQFLHDMYWKLYENYWITLSKISPRYATVKWYKNRMGRAPDLDAPQTLTEKLQYLKLNDYFYNPVVRQCADKYKVREYVKKCGCEEILNELYAAYDSTAQIDWGGGVPDSFVLKCNIICRDKKTLNKEDAVKKLDEWMRGEYGLSHVEFSYEGIERKIICEKLIETEDGGLPRDFKIFCSYGVPRLIYVISGRTDTTENLDYFTPDWEWIPVRNGNLPNAARRIEKPKMLSAMLQYASKLSREFPIVRVDLYCEFGKVIFGELTFLPTGGCFKLDPLEYDFEFGKLFPLKKKG